MENGGERDLEMGLMNFSPSQSPSSLLPSASPWGAHSPALVVSSAAKQMEPSSPSASSSGSVLVQSNSEKRIDQALPALVLSNLEKKLDQGGKKKYVKQVTWRHNDTELYLAAQRGDLAE